MKLLAAILLLVVAVFAWQSWFGSSSTLNDLSSVEVHAVAEPEVSSTSGVANTEQVGSDTGVSVDSSVANEVDDMEQRYAPDATVDQTFAPAPNFPEYLRIMLDGPFSLHTISSPEGCMTNIAGVLEEMRLETRDALWADRVEAELRAIWTSSGQQPLPLSVGCRSTICQVSAVGQMSDDVGQNYRSASRDFRSSDLAMEFSSMRQIYGRRNFGDGELRPVALWVLVSNGNSAPREQPHCVYMLL